MRINSIRFKASILYSAILAVILIIFGSCIYFSIHNILFHDLDEELRIKAEEIAGILNAYELIQRHENHPLYDLLEIFENRGLRKDRIIIDDLWRTQVKALNLQHDFINVINTRGNSILVSNNFSKDISDLLKKDFSFSLTDTYYKSFGNERLKLRAVNYPIFFQNVKVVVQVATSLEPITGKLRRILLFIICAIIGILIITSFTGGLFAHNVLKPVVAVTNLADNITHKNLNQRIKTEQPDEEMKRLVNSFNVMIERLEGSFNHINEFSSHVAHELKTPLAVVKGEIELALEHERPSEEYKRVLNECLEEIDCMIRVIKDLLLLAKLDYKPEIFKFERMNMVQFFNEIYEHSKILATQKDIKIKYSSLKGDVFIKGDRVHLRRLFLNIISNAVTFTSRGGEIALRLAVKDENVHIDISDTGEGISSENIKKIFNKFYRAPKDEARSDAGTGLGLSIALSIAKAHNGTITAQSQLHKGTTFTVVLPLD